LSSEWKRSADDILTGINTKDLEGKRAVVTGAAGFLGSWVCDALVSAGARVLALDNLSSGDMHNIEHLRPAKLFEFRNLDMARERIPETDFDYVLHLASRASPEEYQLYQVETLLANSVGIRNVLDAAQEGDAVVVYASSSEVYGDADVLPTPETYWGRVNPIGIRSCYDEGKRFGEALCMAYFRQRGTNVRIARIFNTYGPRMRTDGPYARVIPRFVAQAVAGHEITVFGDGSHTRSFCYFTDTVAGLLKMLIAPGAKGEVLNIGNPAETKVIDLAELVKGMSKSGSRVVFRPLPEDDPIRRVPDIAKARRLLNWSPKVDLATGLRRTIDSFVEGHLGATGAIKVR